MTSRPNAAAAAAGAAALGLAAVSTQTSARATTATAQRISNAAAMAATTDIPDVVISGAMAQFVPGSRVEAVFHVHVLGNPFDDTENNLQAVFVEPDNSRVAVPAFFDGDDTWRARIWPQTPGTYRLVEVTRNGARLPGAVACACRVERDQLPSRHGYVRRDPRQFARFAFDDGSVYYPFGEDVAWQNGPPVPAIFDHMGVVGENWARVWMNHWDGKNLDWPTPAGGLGTLSLDVARKWDGILQAAERNDIYVQMTLQHHGQYSSTVNPNWGENPWNKANGGFLATPEEFFTDPKAITLTKAKYRYIIARWGYSPHLMAFELFNEVQFTDAIRNHHPETVAAWHGDMAAFIRAQDPYHHLITTSSDTGIPGLFDHMDYIQEHTYPPDVISATQSIHPSEWQRPAFFGEIGSGGRVRDSNDLVHGILWGSMMSEASGTAQYWEWDRIERDNLYPQYAAAAQFLRLTGLPQRVARMHSIVVGMDTRDHGRLAFGPGGGWGSAKTTTYPILPSGAVPGAESMPSFVQGTTHADMASKADFPVDMAVPGTFSVTLGQIAKSGAHPVIRVDGATAAEKDYPAGDRDQNTSDVLSASVPAGHHVIELTNTGPDWVRAASFSLSPFGPTLAVLGKADDDSAALWIRSTEPDDAPRTGRVTIPAGLGSGTYDVTWFDTATGAPLSHETLHVEADQPAELHTPPITHDIAVFLHRTGK
jgi:hypothetical protein